MDIDKTIAALTANGMTVIQVANSAEAKQKVLELLPLGAEVMTLSSVTIDALGLAEEINGSGKYASVKTTLKSMDKQTQGPEMRRLGTAPEWAVGSVHAITESGQVIIASNTGSQLPADAYGAAHVIWVVGTQKIVPDLEAGFKRISEYILPLESARLAKVYEKPELKSNVSKLLVINKEIAPNRITIILVPEVIGF